ncbi:MAG: hypothetical protein V7K64_33375 [Nostoc sp.]|uniref:hypothetical protein n=1 Tax=unclassified Nostoc TaxID=2593658 RepID=UPI001DFF3FDD|nr:hypothetical protein [Nostoc sp. JL34]MBN3882474.1 hypothetical protein [Nostoc sp. JL34]
MWVLIKFSPRFAKIALSEKVLEIKGTATLPLIPIPQLVVLKMGNLGRDQVKYGKSSK